MRLALLPMTTFLIDYENTSHHGLLGFRKLSGSDTVVIFLGAKSETATMPVDMVRELTSTGDRPRLLWKRAKKTGRNYLDLQLVSYLGALIGDPAILETDYVVVSKDRDFDAAIDFWTERRRDVTIALRASIASDPVGASTPATPAPVDSGAADEQVKRAVRAAVKELQLKPSDYAVIYRAFAQENSVQELHTRLSKDLKDRGPRIFASVKPIFLQLA